MRNLNCTAKSARSCVRRHGGKVASQSERLAYRQQALRDVVVAAIDNFLWLGEKQRKHFEGTAAELVAPLAIAGVQVPVQVPTEFFERADRELLSPWQRRQFEELNTRWNQ